MNQNHKYINNFTEYEKALQFLEKGCKCGCSAILPREKFAKQRARFQFLSKEAREIFLMAQLLLMNEGEITTSSRFPKRERTNKRTFYRWNNKTPICQETYLNMLGISHIYLEWVRNHLNTKGLSTRIHGNTGKIPIRKTKMLVSQDIKEEVKSFILNYAKTYGLPNPGRSKGSDSATIFLPAEMSYRSVYNDFLNSLEADSNLKQLNYRPFIKIWKQLTPHIGFMSPRSDLCDACHKFRSEIHSCEDEKKKTTQKKNLNDT
jgi:hypothetical protein